MTHYFIIRYLTLQLLFRGHEIFKTSKYAEQGTRGVWAAYQPARRLLCLDTPPIHHKNSSFLLMKVIQNFYLYYQYTFIYMYLKKITYMQILAISDLVIYRTRSERLSEDLFKFLGEASKTYIDVFQVIFSFYIYFLYIYMRNEDLT